MVFVLYMPLGRGEEGGPYAIFMKICTALLTIYNDVCVGDILKHATATFHYSLFLAEGARMLEELMGFTSTPTPMI